MPSVGAVLLVDARTYLLHAAESDLVRAGFDVVWVTAGMDLLATARRQALAAVVFAGVGAPLLWRLWQSASELHQVPTVVIGKPRQGLWPLVPFVRADAYVGAADLKREGFVANAVRALMARTPPVPPTDRQRFGEALWKVGSLLYAVSLPLFLAAAMLTLKSGGRGILWVAPFIAAGRVLMDAGGRLGLGQRTRIRWESWVWIVLAALAVRVLLATG